MEEERGKKRTFWIQPFFYKRVKKGRTSSQSLFRPGNRRRDMFHCSPLAFQWSEIALSEWRGFNLGVHRSLPCGKCSSPHSTANWSGLVISNGASAYGVSGANMSKLFGKYFQISFDRVAVLYSRRKQGYHRSHSIGERAPQKIKINAVPCHADAQPFSVHVSSRSYPFCCLPAFHNHEVMAGLWLGVSRGFSWPLAIASYNLHLIGIECLASVSDLEVHILDEECPHLVTESVCIKFCLATEVPVSRGNPSEAKGRELIVRSAPPDIIMKGEATLKVSFSSLLFPANSCAIERSKCESTFMASCGSMRPSLIRSSTVSMRAAPILPNVC